MTRTLADWLDYQQRIHPRDIALGLDRVRVAWQHLGSPRGAPLVITVGGTNGKGSTVAFLEAMLAEAGLRVGAFTSPHLVRYNERVRRLGIEAGDAELVEAFERIEHARGEVPLTYFEFGTLAALLAFERAALDVAVLEVGLGGRLDAVNLVDADAAIVTTVDLDHLDYLGGDREVIGFEKAGIFRAGRPAIVGEPDPPASVLAQARTIGARLERASIDFTHRRGEGGEWTWSHRDGTTLALPIPRLEAPAQFDNASAAIAALHALRDRVAVPAQAVARGIARATVPGRLQRIGESPAIVVDVGHNPQAARELARWLEARRGTGRVLAVFAALGDKDVSAIAGAVLPFIDAWLVAGLEAESPRGIGGAALAQRLDAVLRGRPVTVHADVAAAVRAALAVAAPDDLVLAFGSFHTVVAAQRELAGP